MPATASVVAPVRAAIEAGTSVCTDEVDQLKPSLSDVNEPPVTESESSEVPVVIEPESPLPVAATCSTPPTVATATSTLPDPEIPIAPGDTTPFETVPPIPAKIDTPVSVNESALSAPAV